MVLLNQKRVILKLKMGTLVVRLEERANQSQNLNMHAVIVKVLSSPNVFEMPKETRR